jgi:hypothetical protein
MSGLASLCAVEHQAGSSTRQLSRSICGNWAVQGRERGSGSSSSGGLRWEREDLGIGRPGLDVCCSNPVCQPCAQLPDRRALPSHRDPGAQAHSFRVLLPDVLVVWDSSHVPRSACAACVPNPPTSAQRLHLARAQQPGAGELANSCVHVGTESLARLPRRCAKAVSRWVSRFVLA